MLKVTNLDVHYGKLQVLRNISLDVNEGELVTLIGSNGAGKTTLLMSLSGIIKPTRGEIEFLGVRIEHMPSHKIVRLGLAHVPQGRMLFPDMTVLENLEMGASPDTNVKEVLEEVYSYFRILAERKGQKAGTLSGGEQQMLAVGRALMTKPKLLLLDEPTSGLSPIMVQGVADIVTHLHQKGVTVLLVEQNASLALGLGERGYLLQSGNMVASGTAAELSQSDLVKKVYLGI